MAAPRSGNPKRGWNDDGTGMHKCDLMRVVEVERMHHRAVGERGGRGAHTRAETERGGLCRTLHLCACSKCRATWSQPHQPRATPGSSRSKTPGRQHRAVCRPSIISTCTGSPNTSSTPDSMSTSSARCCSCSHAGQAASTTPSGSLRSSQRPPPPAKTAKDAAVLDDQCRRRAGAV